MRSRLIFEAFILTGAVFCAGGWYWQFHIDHLKVVQTDAAIESDGQQIVQLEQTITALKQQAEIAERHAASEKSSSQALLQGLLTEVHEMRTASRRQPTGNYIMHFYPRDNSID